MIIKVIRISGQKTEKRTKKDKKGKNELMNSEKKRKDKPEEIGREIR